MKKFFALAGLIALASIAQAVTPSVTKPTMYDCTHDIRIGTSKVQGFARLEIVKSAESLSDVATLDLPATRANVPVQIEDKIKRGDRCVIALGYDGDNNTEFTGYVRSISLNEPIKVEMEDEIFLMRRPVNDKLLKAVSVKQVLAYVVEQINAALPGSVQPFSLVSDVEGFKFDKFLIRQATGYQVLEKLKQDTGLALYCRGSELHCHLLYTERRGVVGYDFGRNIMAGHSLEYTRAQDTKLQVHAIGRSRDNATVEVTVGTPGGEVRTLKRPNVSDRTTLEVMAKEQLKRYAYDGYKGKFNAWLKPYVEHGGTAVLTDPDFPDRKGRFYVANVTTRAEASVGMVREVGISLKL